VRSRDGAMLFAHAGHDLGRLGLGPFEKQRPEHQVFAFVMCMQELEHKLCVRTDESPTLRIVSTRAADEIDQQADLAAQHRMDDGSRRESQSTSEPNNPLHSAGTRMASRVSGGPASSNNTRTDGSAESRLANTQPALPAPTMT